MPNRIQVISLARSAERRNDFKKKNDHISYDFFEGTDGNLIPESAINDPQLFKHPLAFPSLGAYGCALSHLALWNEAIEKNAPITVAEDDAIFRRDFHLKSEAVISGLPEDWDFILWGWNFDSILSVGALPKTSPVVMLFNQDELRKNINNFINQETQPHAFRLDKCFGIPAYTISPGGAKKFKEACFPLQNFELYFPVLNRNIPNTGIDIAMNRIYASSNSFVSFPPLVVTENRRDISTIQEPDK